MATQQTFICYMKPYIQPFERYLAKQELTQIAGNSPHSNGHEHVYDVISEHPLSFMQDRLTYWEQIHPKDQVSIQDRPTLQVRREATANIARNGIRLDELQDHLPYQQVPFPKRRALRYGPHGIHEYRGKFFPQLVRSLLNIAGIGSNAWVLDPMCGSGTTPVEAMLAGHNALGLDLNPLSVLVSRAKHQSLNVPRQYFQEAYYRLLDRLKNQPAGRMWFNQLPIQDQEYLQRWFASHVLDELDPIANAIQAEPDVRCRNLFLVTLSNILRSVSWQKNDDLRVRKEAPGQLTLDVRQTFLSELTKSVRSVLAFQYENVGYVMGTVTIREGDARFATEILYQHRHQIDAIVTSPPYATALPYLDTDRLSLSYLNLLTRPQHRQRDYDMIGNREINNRIRELYWQEYQQNKQLLPQDVTTVIDRINYLNSNADVGFRRQNLSSLLARYFFDMRQVLREFMDMLRPDAPAYVVVGNNYTIAGGRSEQDGGERITIKTDKLLAQIGESVGLRITETISMEMLTSRDIFRKNTGSTETIICFRN